MKKKIILISILIVILGAYFGYSYMMAPPKDINKAVIDVKIDAKTLALEFTTNEQTATVKYNEKVIAVKGTITSTEDKSITLDHKVTCGFENTSTLKKGNILKIKGLFIGFDDLLEEVKLDKCSVLK